MCGIAGYIGIRPPDTQKINRTLELMKNRGPDNRSWKSFQNDKINVCLLHSRLSIIDLDERSNQPYSSNNCTLVYNGEIYNYLEVRQELKRLGHKFKSKSDTEVLLRAYLEYGEDCVHYFNGMWAFALWDNTRNKLFLSRDRFAEKPLYYLSTSSGIFFGSEVKFIKSLSDNNLSINYNQICRYLVNGYKSLYKQNETYYDDIYEVGYASTATVNSDLVLSSKKYWEPKTVIKESLSIDDSIGGVREHLFDAVKLRLRADVPLAFCLSGGIDSASLVSIAAKKFNYNVHSFSIIDKDERYDESENIKATIEDIGCDHTLINLEPTGMFERLKSLVAYHDGPIATISYLVHSMLSEQISGHGYKIAVSGTAADELLTGYYDHFNLQLYELRDQPKFSNYLREWEAHVAPIVRNPYLQDAGLYMKNPLFRDHIYLNQAEFESFLIPDFHESFTETQYNSNLLRNRMLNELFHEGSRVILHEDDLNSMYYSIENRSPYLDKELFEFAYSIPTEHLIRDGFGKYALREAVKGCLNDKVRLDRSKKGFNASINSVLDLNDQKTLQYLLEDSPVFDILNREKITQLLKQKSFVNSYKKFLFNFINVKLFLA